MQWLVTLYCAIMGAVQLYTKLPVGCNSRFSPLTSCNIFGHKLVTGSNTLLLLDAAPIRIPIYLSVAPTALDFVATPRTESVTPTSFDRVIYIIHPLSDDADAEWIMPSSDDQGHHPVIDMQAPKHPNTIAATLLPYIAMFLFAVLPRPHGGPSMLDVILRAVYRVTDSLPRGPDCPLEDTGNRPIVNGCAYVAVDVPLPDEDGDDDEMTEDWDFIFNGWADVAVYVPVPDDDDLAEDPGSIAFGCVDVAVNVPLPEDDDDLTEDSDSIVNGCAVVAVNVPLPDDDDDLTEDVDSIAFDTSLEPSTVPIVLDVTEPNHIPFQSTAPHCPSSSPEHAKPCNDSALSDTLSSSSSSSVSSVSAHITQLSVPETVGHSEGGRMVSERVPSSAQPVISPPLAPLQARMRLRSLSTSAADSPDIYRRDDAIAKFMSRAPRKAPVLSPPSASPPVRRQRRSRSIDSYGTRRAGDSSSAAPRRRSSSVSAVRTRDARNPALYTVEIPAFVDEGEIPAFVDEGEIPALVGEGPSDHTVTPTSSTIIPKRPRKAARPRQPPKRKQVCCRTEVDTTSLPTVSPEARLEWFNERRRAGFDQDVVAPDDCQTIYHDRLGLCSWLTYTNCIRNSGGACPHPHIPQSVAGCAPAVDRCPSHQPPDRVCEKFMEGGVQRCSLYHCDKTEDLWTAWDKWIYLINECEQNPDCFDWLDEAHPLSLANVVVLSQPASSSDISKPEPIAEPVVNLPTSTRPRSQNTSDPSSQASTSSAPVSSTPVTSSGPRRNRRPRQEDRNTSSRENDVWSHDRFGEDGEPQVPHGRLGGPAKGRGRSGRRGRKPPRK